MRGSFGIRHDVFMAGFGGQGILLAGNLLAYAAILDGRNASYFPAYGVEKRGGAAMCTVVIAEGEVGSPVVGSPQSALLLNRISVEKYLAQVRSGGFCLLNSNLLLPQENPLRDDLTVARLPLNEMALEIGDVRLANMIALGAYARRTGAVTLENLKKGLGAILPERNHRFIPLNIVAIDSGAAAIG